MLLCGIPYYVMLRSIQLYRFKFRICVYIPIYARTEIHVHVCMYIYIYEKRCTRAFVRTYTCMYV